MAFYIRDNRQANFKENVKKVNTLRDEAKQSAPTYAKAKMIVAILGFILGAILLIAAFKMGLNLPPGDEGAGPGGAAFISGILSFAGSLMLLAFLNNYYAYGCGFAAIFYALALVIPLFMNTNLTTKVLTFPFCGFLLASGFIAKLLFEGLVRMGLRKPTNQPGSMR